MGVNWHGSNAVAHQPGSPDIRYTAEQILTLLTLGGPLDSLQALVPAVGAAVDGYAGLVVESRLLGGRGGKGTLAIRLVAEGESAESEEVLKSFWEIDWMATEKPLATNPKLDQGSPGIRQTMIDEVEAWRSSPQQRKRNYQIPKSDLTAEPKADNDDHWETLEGPALKVAQKMAAGIEAWLEFNPVVTYTRIYNKRPTTGGCGMIQTPEVNVAGYEYLKNGDNIVQLGDGTWQRTETWQGSDKWDTDLYETASGGGGGGGGEG